jgi:hypothetical protein
MLKVSFSDKCFRFQVSSYRNVKKNPFANERIFLREPET